MRQWKQYGAPLFTLALTVLGAAMPWLAGRAQDAGIDRQQERMELNAVSLTLREDGGVTPVLRLLTGEYTAIPWEKETDRSWEEVRAAAMEMIGELDRSGLLPPGDREQLEADDFWTEPVLLVGEDSSTALVWHCYWESTEIGKHYYLMVDDVSGKAVEFSVRNPAQIEYVEQKAEIWAEKSGKLTVNVGESLTSEEQKSWIAFLERYYGIRSVGVAEEDNGRTDSALPGWLRIEFDLQDGTGLCRLELGAFEGIISFNIR